MREKMEAGGGAHLTALHVYPLKSAGGISVASVSVDAGGLEWDRRWMLVDDAGRFVSQRTHPRMALLRTRFENGELCVSAPGRDTLRLPTEMPEGPHLARSSIHVWYEHRDAVDCGDEAARWASGFLGAPCRVVRARETPGQDRVTAEGKVRTGFADAEPALVISTASLDGLNARLSEPVPMSRFRPNLVVTGGPAHAEDHWTRVRIGESVIRAARPCPRCALTTVDQDTGVAGKEPLRTLSRYRRLPDGQVGFGMNVRFERAGVLRVGEAVENLDGPRPGRPL